MKVFYALQKIAFDWLSMNFIYNSIVACDKQQRPDFHTEFRDQMQTIAYNITCATPEWNGTKNN